LRNSAPRLAKELKAEFPIRTVVSHIACLSCSEHDELFTGADTAGISGVSAARFCPSNGLHPMAHDLNGTRMQCPRSVMVLGATPLQTEQDESEREFHILLATNINRNLENSPEAAKSRSELRSASIRSASLGHLSGDCSHFIANCGVRFVS